MLVFVIAVCCCLSVVGYSSLVVRGLLCVVCGVVLVFSCLLVDVCWSLLFVDRCVLRAVCCRRLFMVCSFLVGAVCCLLCVRLCVMLVCVRCPLSVVDCGCVSLLQFAVYCLLRVAVLVVGDVGCNVVSVVLFVCLFVVRCVLLVVCCRSLRVVGCLLFVA